MATVIEYDGKQFLLTFSEPEKGWISDLAKCLGITKEAVVGAAMNKGLCYYSETFIKEAVTKMVTELVKDEIHKPTSETKDHKTYDKGPCKG